uniref:Uncharacterized protein n=1 Tax=Timema monikensis TaxID=170555 RepID=A0A7R9E4J1_9NEOP|nr:unnamed protein product [Timema monikensis]
MYSQFAENIRGEVHILFSVDCTESLANPVDLLTSLFSNILVLGILPRDASGPRRTHSKVLQRKLREHNMDLAQCY